MDTNNSSQIKHCDREEPGQRDQQIAENTVQQERNLDEYKNLCLICRKAGYIQIVKDWIDPIRLFLCSWVYLLGNFGICWYISHMHCGLLWSLFWC